VPPLLAVFKKIDRAIQHLNHLNATVEEFFHAQDFYGLFRVHGETNSQRTKLLLRAELLQELPFVEWGIIVGDAVHCLRSALDQLAWTLSLDPDKNTAFPICRTRKEWYTQAPAALWGIPEPLVAAIKRSQPYHRGDAAHTHPLAILGTLSNTDKHKFIPVTALVPDLMEWGITSTQGIAKTGTLKLKTGNPLETGAVLAELPIEVDGSGLDPQVQMDGEVTFRIAFGRGPGVPSALQGKPLIPAMGDLGEAVNEVLRNIDEEVAAYMAAHRGPPAASD
jgi:hypothetical protein